MPFVVVRVNMAITTEQELALKAQLGQAISQTPLASETARVAGPES